jgi:hypothetical protein
MAELPVAAIDPPRRPPSSVCERHYSRGRNRRLAQLIWGSLALRPKSAMTCALNATHSSQMKTHCEGAGLRQPRRAVALPSKGDLSRSSTPPWLNPRSFRQMADLLIHTMTVEERDQSLKMVWSPVLLWLY